MKIYLLYSKYSNKYHLSLKSYFYFRQNNKYTSYYIKNNLNNTLLILM